MTMRLSRFENERDNAPKAWETDWDGLVAALGRFRQGKKSGPAWSPAAYPPGVSRGNAGVESVACLVLDFDAGHGWEDFCCEWERRGLAFAVHTTAAHTDDVPRWRAVFPLEEPVAAAEWPALCRALTDALGHGAAELHDDPARLYYLPTAPASGASYTASSPGRALRADDAPADAPHPPSRPGDAYAESASWEDILEPAGWTKAPGGRGGVQFWARPGKRPQDGHSARTGPGTAGDRFYCWSTEAGVPCGRLLTKFGLFAEIQHGGDFSAAARALARMGYGGGPQPRKDGLPTIETNGRPPRDVVDDALAALRAANRPARWFLRGGVPVEAQPMTDGTVVRPLDADALADRLSRAADFVSVSQKRGTVDVVPPAYAVRAVLSLGSDTGLPVLEHVSLCPFVAPGGRTVAEPGYDKATRTYLDMPAPVHAVGTGKDAAKWLVDELLADFPFQGQADLAAALACMLTPFVRPYIDGPVPLFLFDAPSPATGKTLCAQVSLAPGCGAVGAKAPPSREEEWTKMLTTYALAARPAVLVDNVSGRFESPSLMAAVTAGIVEDRRLGGNELLVLPVRTIFAATANNARLAPDFVSRCAWVRLDAGAERPEERTGFSKPRLLSWAIAHRAECQARCLAMAQAWTRDGAQAGDVPPTRFAAWAETLGGVLQCCGVEGLLANVEDLRAANDDDRIIRAGALADLRDLSGGSEFLLADLWERAMEMPGFQAFVGMFEGAKNLKRAVGNALSGMVGQVLGDTSLVRGGRSKGGRRFKVVTPSIPSYKMESTRVTYPNGKNMSIGGTPKMCHGGDGVTIQVQTEGDTSPPGVTDGLQGAETW